MSKDPNIKITKNGPYLVSGSVPLSKGELIVNEKGYSLELEEKHQYPLQEEYALCRCGRSSDKPYCDGTHAKVNFDGTETTSREPFMSRAGKVEGADIILIDVEDLCSSARFCDVHGGIWRLTENSSDPQAKAYAIDEARKCPSGRLVMWDKQSGEALEPEFKAAIVLIEDPANNCSGPLFVKSGIPIEAADGYQYEVRNRVTLCRCGQSRNKPFCDSTHIAIRFKG